MSAVHDAIAQSAYDVQSKDIRDLFAPYVEDLITSSWYPDVFADSSMTQAAKDIIDVDASKYIYPLPPTGKYYQRVLELTTEEIKNGISPLREAHLNGYYLHAAVDAFQEGDYKTCIKFCGVYSHLIGDTGEPIHAVDPRAVDIALPPPAHCMGMELHTTTENLCAAVKIGDYEPRLLGTSRMAVQMKLYEEMEAVKLIGAEQVVPMVQRMYAGDPDGARDYSSVAQTASARLAADFIKTVVHLAREGDATDPMSLELWNYPHAACDIDMLYRFRPIKNMSLVPYSNGKTVPLSLLDEHGKLCDYSGFGLVPFLGPPHVADCKRDTWVEYAIEPGAYTQFKARVGGNPRFEGTAPRAVFVVYGDGVEIARSPEMRHTDSGYIITAEVSNIRWLRLEMTYVHNATKEDVAKSAHGWFFHGVWAEPTLS